MPEEHHNIRDFRNTFTKEICLSEDLSPHQPSRIFSDLFCCFLYRNLQFAIIYYHETKLENDTFDYRFVYLEKTKDVKEKLLNSLKGSNSEEGLGLQEIVCNIKESKETIKIIKHYMEIIKSEKKKDHQYCRKATFKKVRKR